MRLAQKVVLNASALAAGRFLMGGLGVVSIGVATRYLGIDAWGQLATATAFIAIVASITDLGLGTIGAREVARRPEEEAEHVLGGVLTVAFLVSLVGGAAAIGLAFLLYGGSDDELTREGILLLLLSVPLAAPFAAVNAYFTARQQAYLGAAVSLLGSVITLGLVITAATLDLGYTGVVWAYVIAALVQSLTMCAVGWGKVRLRPSFDRALCRQLVRWMLPVGGALVVHSLYWRIDIILLSMLAPTSEVALYALAFRIVDVVMVLPNYLHVTIMPELARVAWTPRFNEIMEKTFSALVVGAMGVFVLFVAFAEELTVLIGGHAFDATAPVLQILMLAVAFAYVGSMFGDAFFVHDRLKVSITVALLVLPANIALNLLLIPMWEARGAAVAWVASEIIIVVSYAFLYRRMIGGLPRVSRAAQILAATCATATVALIKLLPFADDVSPLVTLIAGGSLCSLVYVGALYALKAMPRELHTNVVLPLVARLRPSR